MKKYYSVERYLQYVKQQNINRKSCLIAIDCIIETIKKFDGKIYNKRFDSFLDECLHNAGLKNTYFTMDKYGSYFYVRDNDSYRTGEYSCDYVNYTYYMCELFSDDKRINAKKLIPFFEDKKIDILKQIETTEYEAANIDTIKIEYENILSQIKAFNTKYSYEIQRLFELKEY